MSIANGLRRSKNFNDIAMFLLNPAHKAEHPELLELTKKFARHPHGYRGPCRCRECVAAEEADDG